ncbi:MAG: tetratricopeptide repeat protein, partial [Pseudomonadota bacterium]
MPFVGLWLIFAVIAIVHVIKTGRSQMWIMVLLGLPLLGTLAYLVVEVLPEVFAGRSARRATGKVSKVLNQGRDFKEAKNDYELSGSVQSACNLAQLHEERGEYTAAEKLYRESLTGLNKTNPDIMHKLARARFELQNFTQARNTLDELIAENPDYKNQDAHLLYARTLESLNEVEGATEEYEALIKYYTGPEPAYRYAMFLQDHGDNTRAASLLQQIVKTADMSPGHFRSMHAEWINKARKEL